MTILTLAIPATLVGCGSSSDGDAGSTSTSPPAATVPQSSTAETAPTPSAPPKPDVEIPAQLPTELVITDLTPGTGPEAAAGDTVVVHYVGVRSVDGSEFDNSYDRGEPFPVVLGAGSVIQGWDDGLLGVQQGARRQLDIPADLAYGDSPQGDVIQAGDALTFVIDVVAVIAASDPADAPEITVEGGPNVEKIDIEDLVVGDGATIQAGQTAVVQIIAFRADTGEQINSSWESGQPLTFTFASGDTIAGLELGVDEMKVGGRRKVVVPYVLAFGDAGSPDNGLPATTDMVLVLDLIAAY